MTERTWIIETPEQLMRLAAYLPKVSLERVQEVVIRDHKAKRTNSANARLWALHGLAAGVTGHSADEMHEFALCRFFGHAEQELAGIIRCVPIKRSSQRNTKEFSELMESTEAWYGTEFGVWLDVLG